MTDWEKMAKDLWQLLDDIDTVDDWARSNDVAYRRNARKIAAKRFEHMHSDGHIVWPVGEKRPVEAQPIGEPQCPDEGVAPG